MCGSLTGEMHVAALVGRSCRLPPAALCLHKHGFDIAVPILITVFVDWRLLLGLEKLELCSVLKLLLMFLRDCALGCSWQIPGLNI